MFELVKITDTDYYIDCPTKIGIVKLSETEAYIIDSGIDGGTGKKILRVLEEMGLTLSFIINTHAHSDHIGGNGLLQARTGCKIYAAKGDCAIINNDLINCSMLYGGYPFEDIKGKFFLSEDSVCLPIEECPLPEGTQIIPLPGHAFDMIGVLTPDGTAYIGDALASVETLEKYKVNYIYRIDTYLQTAEAVKDVEAKVFVPSHGTVTDDIAPCADFNIKTVNTIADDIVSLCKTPLCFDALLQGIFNLYELKMSVQQHLLVGSTIRSYLSYLKDSGRIEAVIEDNIMLWQSK